jgi:molecular chaperone HscB
MNYFELYEIPITLKPDSSFVKKKFYELSRRYHPDFFTQAAEGEKASMLEKASLVNQAFRTFQSEDATIKYVLQLKNLLEDEEKYQLSPDFLMEVMEINEKLMDGLDVENKDALNETEAETKNMMSTIYEEVKPIVEGYQEGVSTEKEFLQVKEYYFKKKYLQRILGKIDEMRNIAPRF